MLSDIQNSIKASMYERATSPLFGTFLLSWCIWNYKIIFVLTSSLAVTEKFKYIEDNIYNSLSASLGIGIFFPLITALLFIFLYPYPSKYIYEYWHKKQKELKEIKQAIDDETPLTIEESRQIRRELLRLESEYYSELSSKDSEIERLKNDLLTLSDQISSPTKKPAKTNQPKQPDKKQRQTLSDGQISIIKMITERGGSVLQNEIIAASDFDKVKTEYYIEDLVNQGYVYSNYRSHYEDYELSLTTNGKKMAVEKEFAK